MEKQKTTSVVLVDDHESVRRGIRDLLKHTPDIQVIGEASNGVDALKCVQEMNPDVLVLDIEMPGLNGIEVTRRLKRLGSEVRILILSAYDDQEYIQEVLRYGASGYIVKGEAPQWVVEAVRGVARGEKGWVSSQVAQKIQSGDGGHPQFTITYRELEILRLYAGGFTEPEIGAHLGLSTENLRIITQKLINKLGVSTQQEAIEVGKREGWI
jgi:two-component system nitrate/nitrite response regulator NarL